MALSAEDNLRLNVLLAQDLHAVRINHSTLTVHALTDKGEAKVPLSPTGREDKYIKEVQQLLSTHVLGSPGGYPVYLKRWTRMGQQRGENLDRLLLLGEPEAVVAVVHSPGLSAETARRAWWAFQDAEHARQMLRREAILNDDLAKELAAYLLEFLPFEESHRAMMESVRLVLHPGLVSDAERESLWKRTKRKNSYYVGFLQAMPAELPMETGPHPQQTDLSPPLQTLIETNNQTAAHLAYLLKPEGQAWLKTVQQALAKPNDQDVVVALMELIGGYFAAITIDQTLRRDIQTIQNDCEAACHPEHPANEEIAGILEIAPEARPHLESMIFLSMLSEQIVAPIFGLTDAIGSVMRKRIAPVTDPTSMHLERLTGKAV